MNSHFLRSITAGFAVFALVSPAGAVRVPIAGTSTSEAANPKQAITAVTVSPDGQTLAIVGNLTSSNSALDFVYTVPIAGGTPTPRTSATQSDVDHVARFTPDGNNIIFTANAAGFNQLYTVPVSGGSPSVISTDRVSSSFQLTSDGQNILYISRPIVDDILKQIPITGGSFTQLSTETEGDLDRVGFGLSPNDDMVYFATDFLLAGGNEESLFKVPFDGSAAPTLIPIGQRTDGTFDIDMVRAHPDGNSVLFQSDYTVNNQHNIHSVPIGGGTPVDVVDLSAFPDRDIHHFSISPDNQTIAFSADLDTINIFELYVMPLDGSAAPVKVSDPINAEAIDLDITGDGIPDVSDGFVDGSVNESGEGVIAWSPNSRNIFYVADGEYTNVFEVYMVANPFATSLVGDYNSDGVVDAADYVVWRKTDGTSQGYNDWRNNFGATLGSGAMASNAAVPEPASALLLLLGAVFGRVTRRPS